MLTDPCNKKHILLICLDFECTNNTVEYETLILGLNKVIDLKVELLKVIGDLEVVTRQVRDTIHHVSLNLKNYQHEVWCVINHFKAFNIIFVPRVRNVAADALANAVARMSPLKKYFSIEIIYKPSMLDNFTNLHVFSDDQQILHFMANADVFKDVSIDEDEHDQALQEASSAMKGNNTPKSVVSLEKLYDLQN